MIKDIQEKILKLKKEKNVLIAAHSYQSADILEVADLTGDSFKLSREVQSLDSPTIILCGVRFMAETLKMLSPEKKVIMPVGEATCPMAEQISKEEVLAFKAQNPSFKVVSYINTTAELKSVSDVCVTSSSALKIVNAMKEKDILFIPDKNLGGFIKKSCPDKNVVLMNGCCPVHNAVTEEEIKKAKALHPKAKVLLHPELPADIIKYGDVIGSTADILNFAKSTDEECIIGTENSILDWLKIIKPDGRFYMLSKELICKDMKMTTLSDLLNTLEGKQGEEIVLENELMEKALLPIEAMLELGK